MILTALCTALPAQLGMVIIGGEGALLIGALVRDHRGPGDAVGAAAGGAARDGLRRRDRRRPLDHAGGRLRQYRGVNETISSLLLVYIGLAILNHLVEGAMRDPASLNKPSTREIGAANMIGSIPGTDVHWGLVFGVVAALASYILIYHTVFGFAARVAGGNIRAAKIVGLGVSKLDTDDLLSGGRRGWPCRHDRSRRGAGPHQRQSRRGLWLHRILVAFLARQNPLAVIPVAILLGGISASGGLLQRRLGLPDASVLVLQGIIFVFVLASDALYGRIGFLKGKS